MNDNGKCFFKDLIYYGRRLVIIDCWDVSVGQGFIEISKIVSLAFKNAIYLVK